MSHLKEAAQSIREARDVLDPYGTLCLIDAAKSVKLQQELYYAFLKEIYEVSSGEKQIAPDDTEGMSWIARLVRPYIFRCDGGRRTEKAVVKRELKQSVSMCKYWIVTDGKEAPPLAMFRNEFDATQWQYLQCPTGTVEAFDMAVKT